MSKKILQILGFKPKENVSDIFIKKYVGSYVIEVDFENEIFNYGKKIKAENKTTQNFSQAENWVVLECVDRLLEKSSARLHKDGGQLFTYFKFSNKADIIILYASELKGNEIVYKNEIIKIETDYRVGDAKDFYEKWNKLTKDNGVFEEWVKPYN